MLRLQVFGTFRRGLDQSFAPFPAGPIGGRGKTRGEREGKGRSTHLQSLSPEFTLLSGPSTACNTFCALYSLQMRAFCNESGTPAPGAVKPATGQEVSFSAWTAGTALSAAASFRGVSHRALHLGWMMRTRRNERRQTRVNCLGEMGKGRGNKK